MALGIVANCSGRFRNDFCAMEELNAENAKTQRRRCWPLIFTDGPENLGQTFMRAFSTACPGFTSLVA